MWHMVDALVNNSARSTEGGALACAQMGQRAVLSGFLSGGPPGALCPRQYSHLVRMLLPLPRAPPRVPPFGPSGHSTAPPGVLPGRAPQPFQARLHPSDESRWTHRALTGDGGAKAPPLRLVLGHRHE